MNDETSESEQPAPGRLPLEAQTNALTRLRESTTLKIIALGALFLALLIPLAMIQGLVRERGRNKTQVAHEIASSWGQPQIVVGPVLSATYRCTDDPAVSGNGCHKRRHTIQHVLPTVARWEGVLSPQERHRGIYETVVWAGALSFRGSYPRVPGEIEQSGSKLTLIGAQVGLGLSDLLGVQEGSGLKRGSDIVSLRAGAGTLTVPQQAVHVELSDSEVVESAAGAGARGETLEIELALNLHGTRQLHFAPVASDNSVSLTSAWPSPSFGGRFLPHQQTVGSDGFEAEWRVSGFGNTFPERWWGDTSNLQPAHASAFGVDLITPVDGYQLTTRATKYGALFVLLTFTTFFLLEVTSPVRLHPMQYLLVGAALCLFYLLLLALTEHLGFAVSYLVASIGVVSMISGYAISILRHLRWGLFLLAGLSALYVYLYVLLELEQMALLMGSVALFVILAVVMFITRDLDWYSLERNTRRAEAS